MRSLVEEKEKCWRRREGAGRKERLKLTSTFVSSLSPFADLSLLAVCRFAGAGWWAMRVKDKKRTQGALINEMRTRRLYDSGTLDDDE